MITPDEAQARILALGVPVAVETVPLLEATARWAAHDVTARRTQPARDLSAMDGYAIRYGDLPGPWRVVGESAAGMPFGGHVGTGEAARIFTGAAVPDGADTIIIQEEVAREVDALTLTGEGPPHQGAHIRRAGSDFASDNRLVTVGDHLNPARLALAAMGGHGHLDVHRRLRVAILSTGDELVLPGADTGNDRLPNSNAPMLAAMLGPLPVELVDLGIVPDDRAALATAFARAHDCDILVTSGGASVGDHDLVRPVLIDLGASLDFWKVAMRPGKPLMAGTLGTTIVLGLPGNPVSAFVTATLFLLPLVRHLSGARDPLPRRIPASCNAPLPAVGPRTDFVRARWVGSALAPLPSTDSGVLSSLAQADALIVRPAGSEATPTGQPVEAILLG
ncbi:gephyrin-like molybdotransferase Glp [Sphingomonas sp. SUN039]|uniref:molybdopterin molybdotransferase MoeA n=1 Tax=Sphingomonas sp. SUN039 TaxID=2937787 RepID=UPI002164301F|nr:gephyrin-like molybdotransferase Glp [Sphingomonas sp. SUN039]UVO53191.1 molybdopterin molybdotransferase MoeA [Sphingomonas sp. SUN039]